MNGYLFPVTGNCGAAMNKRLLAVNVPKQEQIKWKWRLNFD